MTEQNGLERSSATEELRRLLDERGVEWIGTSFSTPAKGHPTNTSLGEEHHEATFIEYDDGNVLRLFDLTPEQAVEATLGRGTCEILGYDDGYDEGLDGEMYQYADPRYFLSCEHEAYGSVVPNYCPVCGRKVVDE